MLMISASIVRKRRGGSEWTIYNRPHVPLWEAVFMRPPIFIIYVVVLCAASPAAQGKRLWVLRAPGEMVEYDPSTFAAQQTVKVPAEAVASPSNLSINHLGQMLFAPPIALPLADGDLAAERMGWVWDGRTATTLG